jgi:poly(3-hydroxybutyrate) depolymerase
MRCPRHNLALTPDGECILCRRESRNEDRARPRSWRIPTVLGIAALASLATLLVLMGPRLPIPATLAPGVSGTLSATNSDGRKGAFFLPHGYADSPRPVLVAIHGTGGSGASMVSVFREAAEKNQFIVVAPDSRIAPNGVAGWEVPSRPGETVEDDDHIRHCLDEVLAHPGVRADTTRTLIAGHSGGGSSAPYMASVEDFYTAFAVLHGGVFPGGLGPRRVRGWLSTGTMDSMRPPRAVQDAAEQMRRAGFTGLAYSEFAEGHEVGPQEIEALVQWWLH